MRDWGIEEEPNLSFLLNGIIIHSVNKRATSWKRETRESLQLWRLYEGRESWMKWKGLFISAVLLLLLLLFQLSSGLRWWQKIWAVEWFRGANALCKLNELYRSIPTSISVSLSLSLSSSFFSSRRSLTTPIDMAVFLPPDSFTIPCQSKPVFIVMSFGNSAV